LQLIFPASLGKHISTFIIYTHLSVAISIEKSLMLKAINNKLRAGREKVVHDHIIMLLKTSGNLFMCEREAVKFKFDLLTL